MGDEYTATGGEDNLGVRILLPDGGEDEAPDEDEEEEEEAEDEEEQDEEQEEEETEEEEQEEEETEEEEQEEEDEEGEEEEDEEGEEEEDEEAEETEEEEQEEEEEEEENRTRVLHLNLDGLFLDLLGLEVNLSQVTLDIDAVRGEGNLLGNLLSAVAGLLDDTDLGGLLGLDNLLGDDGLLGGGEGDGIGLPSLPGLPGLPEFPDLNIAERIRGFANAIAERLRNLLGDVIRELPLEELLTQFIETLVRQLLDGDGNGNGNGNGDEGEGEAASG